MARFSAEIAGKIVESLKAGASEHDAAVAAGITHEEFRRWAGRNRAFALEVDKAKAVVAVIAVGNVRRAMAENWQAAAWWLDRTAREEEFERLRALTTS